MTDANFMIIAIYESIAAFICCVIVVVSYFMDFMTNDDYRL